MNLTHPQSPWTKKAIFVVSGLVILQLAAAILVGRGHWMANEEQSFFAPIAVTATIPVLAFLTAYALSQPFRQFVLAQDLRTLTLMQHWRVIGFVFLALYAFDALPALFAFLAGTGDVAIGLTAFYIAQRLDREPDYATSSGFVRFNLFGLLDFAVAIFAAGLTSGAFPSLVESGLTSAPMDVWPLNIFPSFIVPAFIILHLSVLLQVRHLRQTQSLDTGPLAQTA